MSTTPCASDGCVENAFLNEPYCLMHGPSHRTAAGQSPESRIVCPHCGERGGVQTDRVRAKRGISGAKATGAVLTAGFSVLATGLSRKEWITEARCSNCHQTWTF